jgi:hypothetical protein
MPSVGGVCPACKRPIGVHLPSARYPRQAVPVGWVDVVNGRCRVEGQPAAQKCCWVQLREVMTPAEYRARVEDGKIALEPCPCCGGRLRPHDRFERHLAEGEPAVLQGLRLVRGRCTNPDCPVCTVTHYPCFLSPYHVVATAEREAAVRAHCEQGLSWSAMAEQGKWEPASVRRWQRAIAARAADVVTGLLALWQRLDHQAPAEMRVGLGRGELLQVVFGVCAAVAALLAPKEGWQAPVPALAVPRMFRPAPPTTLPVWT